MTTTDRTEAFVELLPADVGHNLRHFTETPEGARLLGHTTGIGCACWPDEIPHSPQPVSDTDRDHSEDAARATPAQVEAAMQAGHCQRYHTECFAHIRVARTDRGCRVAVVMADAVAAAAPVVPEPAAPVTDATPGRAGRYAEAMGAPLPQPTGKRIRRIEAVMAVADAEVEAATASLRAENEQVRRGARTLGEIIDRMQRDVLDATGLHRLIDKDGDGDWQHVWEALAELKPRAEAAEAALAEERAKVAELRKRVTSYRRSCNAILERRWNSTDHGGRLACDYVLQEIDALAGPAPEATEDDHDTKDGA